MGGEGRFTEQVIGSFRLGNIIGRGWDRFRHIFGGSDGRGGYVIFAVDEAQDLHWHRYTGSGASDQDGTSPAWDPRSGTKIGNGW